MMAEPKVIDPTEDPRWDAFVLKHPLGSLFHHSVWKQLIEKTYHYEPHYLILENGNHGLRAGLPAFVVRSLLTGRRMVSLPFADCCDPLVDNQEDLDWLINALHQHARALHTPSLEVRAQHGGEYLESHHFSKHTAYQSDVLDLEGSLDDTLAGFHKGVRRNIRRAERGHLLLRDAEHIKDMEVFYELYVRTRRAHGLPPQPYSFFSNLWALLHPRQMLRLHLVYDNSHPVAGVVGAVFKDTYYALYEGTDRRHMKNRPVHMVFWREIQQSKKLGLRYFDFGRTALDNRGLARFKAEWGAEAHELPLYHYPQSPEPLLPNRRGATSRVVTGINRHLPLAALKLSGKLFYRHFG